MTLPKFKNPLLLRQALTHRSAVNEKKSPAHNERLEFLGDAVLELIVSEYLYLKYPTFPEGQLTALRTALVRTETLAQLAHELEIPQKLIISRGEEQTGGRESPSLLADTLEAVIGALYLDQGLNGAQLFLTALLLNKSEDLIDKAIKLDAKSQFQELVQGENYPTPIYQIIKTAGPDHNRIFTAQVKVQGQAKGQGQGKSKQEAEQAAAHDALSAWYNSSHA